MNRVSRIRDYFVYPYGSRKGALSLLVLLALCPAAVHPAAAQSVSSLYYFTGSPDGAAPVADLVQGTDGNFYGTTSQGGIYNGGTVFRITPAGTMTLLHSFSGGNGSSDGSQPLGALIQGSDGNFYGTTEYGGVYNEGTVFKITPGGVLTTLYSFNYVPDGINPLAGLVQGNDGNVYGTTSQGGANAWYGAVFKITPDGTETVIYSFAGPPMDAATPWASLIQGSDGNFYGTTNWGGAHNNGTVFKVSPAGAEAVLFSFASGVGGNGGYPQARLIQGSDGNFYGTTTLGGAGDGGTVFKVTPAGAETVLHSFAGTANHDGAMPYADLIQGSDGNFYGTTPAGGDYEEGTIFKVTPDGTETMIYSFTGGNDGGGPNAGLIRGSDGNFYGTTAKYHGTVYTLTLSAAPVLKSLSPASVNASGPAFTLLVKGSSFANNSMVNWNGSALTTTYVSDLELKAAVPASLIATPGSAQVSVTTPGGGTSAAKKLTILVTTLKMLSASLSKDSVTGVYTATINLKNSGYLAAPNVKITKATLGLASTSSVLPVSVGSIAAGSSAGTSLAFPGSAGSSGQIVALRVSGTFTGGTFSGSLKVTLP